MAHKKEASGHANKTARALADVITSLHSRNIDIGDFLPCDEKDALPVAYTWEDLLDDVKRPMGVDLRAAIIAHESALVAEQLAESEYW